MGRKKDSKPPINDFEYDEGQVYGFTDEAPIVGNVIASFSCNNASEIQTLELNPASKITDNDHNNNSTTTGAATNETFTSDNNITKDNINIETNTTDQRQLKNISTSTKDIFDNRRTPLPNRATPTIKRTYTLRDSTIRKINELKNVHPDINVCVSSIVDIALDHYHNYILIEGGTQ
ncbi:hypothetical protein psyc5s11_49430 [Clostridium gelidum]|uniref:Uncharacterized protein n=1 Tax=Clostridium gelidum TaxID=704125 RepID=A0ABM7TBY5_9CLOT|nr:hypothetical protein [Clostridium gelidum]BCZ48876.1 hypothetical protein psyc5s11_49430 [Clostridium gelidum]